MPSLQAKLQSLVPEITFESGDAFYWSPGQNKIIYSDSSDDNHADWSLLHETAHALLGHKTYNFDIELLLLEVDAWQKAKELAKDFGISIDEDHIQDCLDTYRDWLHQRATCPRCSTVSFQSNPREYECHNCSAIWGVSTSKFCRPYRLSGKHIKSRSGTSPQATFS